MYPNVKYNFCLSYKNIINVLGDSIENVDIQILERRHFAMYNNIRITGEETWQPNVQSKTSYGNPQVEMK